MDYFYLFIGGFILFLVIAIYINRGDLNKFIKDFL
jgi:hypothetical protein